jgi:hypothetical protein
LPDVAVAVRAIDLPVVALAARWRRSLVTSCQLHCCSHCQLLNHFLADCCIASCCAASMEKFDDLEFEMAVD